MARKKNKKYSGVDPAYLERHRNSLRRIYRFKVSSRSALIRQALMAHVMAGLEENHPTLF